MAICVYPHIDNRTRKCYICQDTYETRPSGGRSGVQGTRRSDADSHSGAACERRDLRVPYSRKFAAAAVARIAAPGLPETIRACGDAKRGTVGSLPACRPTRRRDPDTTRCRLPLYRAPIHGREGLEAIGEENGMLCCRSAGAQFQWLPSGTATPSVRQRRRAFHARYDLNASGDPGDGTSNDPSRTPPEPRAQGAGTGKGGSATFRICLPMFAPLKIRRNVFGMFSNPSCTSTNAFNLPSSIHRSSA